MAVYPAMTITQRGKDLYAKAQAGGTITYTRMRIGSGAYSGDPSVLTDLVQPIDWIDIKGFTRTGSTAHVKGTFENKNIKQPTYSCEIGIYAQDPDLGEILYGYTNAGAKGDYLPPISAGPFSREFQVNIAVGSASEVTAVVPATEYVPYAEVARNGAHMIPRLNDEGVGEFSIIGDATSISGQKLSQLDLRYVPASHIGSGGTAHALATVTKAGFMSEDDKDRMQQLSKKRTGFDSILRIYTIVSYYRKDGSLFAKSVLSNKVNGLYTVRTLTEYKLDGTSERGKFIFDVTYDSDGTPVDEVMRNV